MEASSNLPSKLWTEMTRAAVYLYNQTPRYSFNWKTLYDQFHTHITHQDGVVVKDKKP
jgi:hypothetical protein